MICYKDKWFCDVWLDCKSGAWCGRSATPTVEMMAEDAGLPIQYRKDLECFKPKPVRPNMRW
jgi:hypothetical protein